MAEQFDEISSFKSLYKGLKKAQRSVLWKDSVASYSMNNLKNTYYLRQSLLDDTYKISEYQHFKVYEPKVRDIVATRIKDRQFQRALCDEYLYHAMTRTFIRDNCACQRGKGVDDALDRFDCHLHRFFRKHGTDGWILKCDIHHYFAETSHDIAKEAVRKRVKDNEVYRRTADIIDSFEGDKGIGLGSQVSQLVELAVLDDVDHYIKERLGIRYYIRYMDDFILIHEDKEYLKYCLKMIISRLESLGLQLNRKTNISSVRQGVAFLKWHFYLTESGKVVRRMNKHSPIKERRKLKKLRDKVLKGELPLSTIQESFLSWKANANRGNSFGVIRKMTELYQSIIKECTNGN